MAVWVLRGKSGCDDDDDDDVRCMGTFFENKGRNTNVVSIVLGQRVVVRPV